jgi:hypothetical protein
MLDGQKGREYHDKFRELNALASSGALTTLERSELNSHLDHCEECREVALQYHILATRGIPTIADAYADRLRRGSSDEEATLKKLLARVRTATGSRSERKRTDGCAAFYFVTGDCQFLCASRTRGMPPGHGRVPGLGPEGGGARRAGTAAEFGQSIHGQRNQSPMGDAIRRSQAAGGD